MATEVVCLCQQYDPQQMVGDVSDLYPDLVFLKPEQITDPSAIKYALAFSPEDEAFDQFPNLDLVCSIGAGVDGLLLHPGLRPQLDVVRMINPEQAAMMAGFAAWYVVGHHRKMQDFLTFQSQKEWKSGWGSTAPSSFPIAILGYGAMGQAIGATLKSMGYPVNAWAGREREVDGIKVYSGEEGLAHVLSAAMAVICVLPLTDNTSGILNARTFNLMNNDAMLVQLGRGGHMIEEDLVDALDNGELSAAILDVFQTEPLPQTSPLWSHPKIQVTPHLASDSDGLAVARSVSTTIASHKEGLPIAGLVDRAKGY